MSVNFNVAMLRNLQKPIDESLETSITQLSQYVAGTLSPEDFDAGQHIRLVVGSLSVIGCQAAAKIAETLEDAATGLAKPDRRGWEKEKSLRVAEASLVLTTGLQNHLRELLLDNEDLPVKMWPAWQTLISAMEAPSRSAEELFEPAADFDDLRFALLADDYLKDVTNGMIERLEKAIESLSNTQSSTDTALVLQESLKVFDWAYSLRHGKGYQPYWLALRARISIGLLGDQEKLEDRAEWNVLLKEALLEIHKFARGSRRVSPELLMKTLRPMLIRWPSHWVSSHPILAEADRRLGFRDFWDTLDDVTQNQTHSVSLAGTQFDDQVELLSQIKQGWAQYVSGEGAHLRVSLDKNIALLNSRRSVFADPALGPLFDEIMLVSGELDAPGSVPEDISLEFASALLLLDDAIERRFKVSPSSAAQIGLQTKRLKAARLNLVGDLQQLPKVRWDSKKQERQLRSAKIAAFAEVHKDILLIEEALTEQLRDETYKPDVNKIKSMSVLASAVFRLLECEAAANIITGVSSLIGEKGDEALSSITLGVAGLGAYLTALENGDQDAEHLLEVAHNAVVGRPIPGGSLSEEQWRQTQSPIEEHAVTLPVAISTEENSSVLPVDAPDNLPDSVEILEDNSLDADVKTEDMHVEPPTFNPESIFELGGYRETRTGNELEVFFLEEMEQVLEEISLQRSRLKEDPFNDEARSDLRRQFHTIKGSGRLAGFMAIGEIGYLLEHRLDQDIEENISYSSQVDVLVENVSAELSQWLRELSSGNDIIVNGALVQAWIEASELDENEEVVINDVTEEPIVPGQATPWSPYEQSVPVPVKESEENATLEVAETTEDLGSEVHFSPEVVDINGFGLLDKETFSKIVSDFAVHHDVFENAASTASDEEIEVAPLIAATHDVTLVAASLGMAPIATMGRAFEKYLEELSKTSLWPKWTSAGQGAAEEMWLMVDDLVMRKSISPLNAEVLDALKGFTFEDNSVASEEPLGVTLDAFAEDVVEDEALVAEEAVELNDVVSSDDIHHSDQTEDLPIPDEETVDEHLEEQLQVVEHLLPVVDQLVQERGQALGDGPASELSDEDDDVLWEKLFDSLSTISKELRVVVPLLTKIHERRR